MLSERSTESPPDEYKSLESLLRLESFCLVNGLGIPGLELSKSSVRAIANGLRVAPLLPIGSLANRSRWQRE